MAGAVTSGIGHGIGFGIAGRAVDAVLGPRSMQVTHSNEQGSAAPVEQTSAPMNSNRSCQLYVDDLNQVCVNIHPSHLHYVASCIHFSYLFLHFLYVFLVSSAVHVSTFGYQSLPELLRSSQELPELSIDNHTIEASFFKNFIISFISVHFILVHCSGS